MNKRDIYGLIGWGIISIVIGIFALIPMILREVWQWQYYGLSAFEWDDVQRYGHVIFCGSLINAMLILFCLTLGGVL